MKDECKRRYAIVGWTTDVPTEPDRVYFQRSVTKNAVATATDMIPTTPKPRCFVALFLLAEADLCWNPRTSIVALPQLRTASLVGNHARLDLRHPQQPAAQVVVLRLRRCIRQKQRSDPLPNAIELA